MSTFRGYLVTDKYQHTHYGDITNEHYTSLQFLFELQLELFWFLGNTPYFFMHILRFEVLF